MSSRLVSRSFSPLWWIFQTSSHPHPNVYRRLQTDTRAHKEEDKDQKQQNARRKATPKINEREYHARWRWKDEHKPLEFNSFLCASNRRRFCVPSLTAISNASTLPLKKGLRPSALELFASRVSASIEVIFVFLNFFFLFVMKSFSRLRSGRFLV